MSTALPDLSVLKKHPWRGESVSPINVTEAAFTLHYMGGTPACRLLRIEVDSAGYLDMVLINRGADVEEETMRTLGDAAPRCYHAHLCLYDHARDFAYIHMLWVCEGRRRHGYGGLLMNFVTGESPWFFQCADHPIYYLSAFGRVSHDEERLAKFYERRGFTRLNGGTNIMYKDRRNEAEPVLAAEPAPILLTAEA
jgi:GNAT superfamily N-acetyltransferase